MHNTTPKFKPCNIYPEQMSEWGEAGLCVTRSQRDEREKAQLVYLFCGKLVLEALQIFQYWCVSKNLYFWQQYCA